jgi:hypothetical protein
MTSNILEKQVSELVNTLKENNLKEEKRGARKIPDIEYEKLQAFLLKKVIRG